MRYRMEYLVIVDHEDGMERDARAGWLLIDNIASDDEARTYAEWNDDGLVDCDFLEPGYRHPQYGKLSAANPNVIDGRGPELVGEETFFSAIITKIERVTPIQIGSDARALSAVDL